MLRFEEVPEGGRFSLCYFQFLDLRKSGFKKNSMDLFLPFLPCQHAGENLPTFVIIPRGDGPDK